MYMYVTKRKEKKKPGLENNIFSWKCNFKHITIL